MEAIRRALKVAGGASATAEAVGVSRQTIAQWVDGSRPIPLDRCVELEILTERRVTCEQLRPDKRAFWKYLRTSAQIHPKQETRQ